jgi:hypothetical protein
MYLVYRFSGKTKTELNYIERALSLVYTMG